MICCVEFRQANKSESLYFKHKNSMTNQKKLLRVLVVGCGNMGASHATAYHAMEGVEICGLVSIGKSKEVLNKKLGGGYALFR